MLSRENRAAAYSLLCRFRGTPANRVGLLSYYDWDPQILVQYPYIDAIDPPASLPGGEVRILGRALKPPQLARPEVLFNGMHGPIVVSSEDFVIARVPFGAHR